MLLTTAGRPVMRLGLTAAHARAGRRVALVLPLVDGAGSSTFHVAAAAVLADYAAVFFGRLAGGLSLRMAEQKLSAVSGQPDNAARPGRMKDEG
jgi:hypothetical protein